MEGRKEGVPEGGRKGGREGGRERGRKEGRKERREDKDQISYLQNEAKKIHKVSYHNRDSMWCACLL